MPFTGREEQCAARLAGLTGRRRELLALLALLGRPAPPALLAEASGRTLRDVLDCLDRLASAGLAQPGQDGWIPVPADQPGGHRHARPSQKSMPARAARPGARTAARDTAEVAAHLAASGDPHGASAAYAAAAALRLRMASDDEAMRLTGAGLSLDPTASAQAPAGNPRRNALPPRDARRRPRRPEGCAGSLATALRAAPGFWPNWPSSKPDRSAWLAARNWPSWLSPRPDIRVHAGQALAAAAIIDLPAGNLARAERHLRRARRLLEQAAETRGQARLLYWQAMASYMAGRLREAATRLADLAHLPVMPAEVLGCGARRPPAATCSRCWPSPRPGLRRSTRR